ncbi:FAD-binding oxidoreductase [Mycobacterium numidiamassiliense]|uniref:FAD-binding oxidoreductase n=1 Tax=Mycobacterium numidiamassiliense TaxID=1841861 RepID=UPI0013F60334|nr:FAD-binding oxidoreductase [Mycobacterium numidiamassiliense]
MDDVVAGLRAELSAVVHEPGDDEYARATSPDNSSYPQRPCAVVRPASAEQVAHVVQIAWQCGAPVVVQATGHGAGRPVTDDQVLLDTSALTDVSVNVSRRTAQVGAGAMWPAVQEAAHIHGLLGLSGTSPTVGVAGYTFGGGVGWFVRKHGLASGTLRAVDYIDGAGQLRRACDDATDPLDREALLAFRGGAPVGIATSIEIELFRVPELWTGSLLWPQSAQAAVIAGWVSALEVVSESVTSSLSLLQLPAKGPFPAELLGATVVHLSYASPDGAAHLDVVRNAVRDAAIPVVDTTGPGDLQSLSAIHLDPPAAVPARGTGRWLGGEATDFVGSMFDAARVGQPGGLSMVELRHTDCADYGPAGALTTVPAPFLLHAVGAAPDDDARRRIDTVLGDVEDAGRVADIGRAATSFREGQPDAGDAWESSEQARLRAVRAALDPERVFKFQRHPVF